MCEELKNDKKIKEYGFTSGEVVYMLYSFERDIKPAYTKSEFEKREFGIIKQTIKH